ncbi:MAG: hypothetical protein ACKO1U_10225 [Bacteroidota bacterium]
MEVLFTQQQDWLSYYYNESDLLDSDRIQRAIDGDPLKAADYSEMVAALSMLDIPLLEPSSASIERILAQA